MLYPRYHSVLIKIKEAGSEYSLNLLFAVPGYGGYTLPTSGTTQLLTTLQHLEPTTTVTILTTVGLVITLLLRGLPILGNNPGSPGIVIILGIPETNHSNKQTYEM